MMYDTSKTTTEYIGIAVNKTTQTEGTDPSAYSWSRFKGDQGVPGADGRDGTDGKDGADGKDGKDGRTFYTWIKYADNASGEGMSDSPVSGGALKKYIGFAYNKETAVESDTPSDYSWALFKGTDGEDGVPGEPGADGTTYYTWIK